uniref:ILCR1 Ig-like domain-containing protein n=1 Tax=Caenorhabditis japonica TaxID=281687 RepID=A0A8R1HKP9_CAEJA
MRGNKKYNKSGHTTTTRTVISCPDLGAGYIFIATIVFMLYVPASEASTSCSFNGHGNCSVSTDTEANLERLAANNHTMSWKIRPQNIGFMYYLRTTNDGSDLSVRGIVKWKVQLKNWTPNDTILDGFLVTIMEHDTNETVASYELKITEPFEKFAEYNDVLEMRMELDNVLGFDRRYDAKINILPLGKQPAASSFLSIMGKLKGEKCSSMTGLAERWAPRVMVHVFKTTSEIELSWQTAPAFLCIKTYEIILQNRDGVILNTTEIEVIPGQLEANTTFSNIERNQMIQVKVRGKNAIDGRCACVNCNCITDKTKFFIIPEVTKTIQTPDPLLSTTALSISEDDFGFSRVSILLIVLACLMISAWGCLYCRKNNKIMWKKKIAFNALKTSSGADQKRGPRKFHKILLVCPEIEGKDYDYMMRIANALKNSNNSVVYDRWRENGKHAEENMLRWVNDQTQKAEKIIIFHSTSYQPSCGVYDLINSFFPGTDSRLIHVALTADAKRVAPRDVEYVLPRDQQLLEEAYGIEISEPLAIDIPREVMNTKPFFPNVACDSIEDDSPSNTENHSTDSGVSSMSSNCSESDGINETMQTRINIRLKELNIESHPLLRQAIPV